MRTERVKHLRRAQGHARRQRHRPDLARRDPCAGLWLGYPGFGQQQVQCVSSLLSGFLTLPSGRYQVDATK
eukprot:1761319-Pyramimonas_sp.AAC.1